MVNSAVEVRDLDVVRGRREILQSLDFSLGVGSITGLLGPSGCGKTTLMRVIVGVQAITRGRVTVLGHPAGSAVLRRRVGYASQDASVYDDLSVIDNLRYFAAAVGAGRDDVERVIDRVALGDHRGQLTGRLSGGQRSRVSLAVAMLGAPRVLVLDEPTVGLDPVLREDLWQLFRTLASAGVTLLVSSHVMDEAERCDDIVLLREGRLLTQESPASLKARTGTDSLDTAFLRLVRDPEAAA